MLLLSLCTVAPKSIWTLESHFNCLNIIALYKINVQIIYTLQLYIMPFIFLAIFTITFNQVLLIKGVNVCFYLFIFNI